MGLALVGDHDPGGPPIAPVGAATLRRARAVAEALYSGEEPAPAARLDWLIADLARFLGSSQGGARRIFWLCAAVVTVVGPLLSLRVGFVDEPVAVRREILERMERSRLSAALLALKAILSMIWFEHPDSAREIGVDGLCKRDAVSRVEAGP